LGLPLSALIPSPLSARTPVGVSHTQRGNWVQCATFGSGTMGGPRTVARCAPDHDSSAWPSAELLRKRSAPNLLTSAPLARAHTRRSASRMSRLSRRLLLLSLGRRAPRRRRPRPCGGGLEELSPRTSGTPRPGVPPPHLSRSLIETRPCASTAGLCRGCSPTSRARRARMGARVLPLA